MSVFRFNPRWQDIAGTWAEEGATLREQWDTALQLLEQRDTLLEDYLRRMLSSIDAWTDFTPLVQFNATPATIASARCRYVKLGRLVIADYAFRFANLNGGTGNLTIGYPVTAADYGNSSAYQFNSEPLGQADCNDVSAPARHTGQVVWSGTTVFAIYDYPASFFWSDANFGAVAVAVAVGAKGTGDEFFAQIKYEAAS